MEISERQLKEFNKQLEEFNEQLRVTRVTLYSELINELKQNNADMELVKILCARIVNYFMGEDNELSYQQADERMKKKIDLIQNKILPCANHKLSKDQKTRELVVYTLRMKAVFSFSAQGEAYNESGECKRINEILSKYGAEFSEEAKPKMYSKIVANYYKERFIPTNPT